MIISKPLSTCIGELILNKNIIDLDSTDIAELTSLINLKKAVFFKNQFLNSEQFINLGKTLSNSLVPNLEYKIIDNSKNYFYGNAWHSDKSYKKIIPRYTIFQIDSIPENLSGDTEFCDTVSLYNYGFSSNFKSMLDGLIARHRYLISSRTTDEVEVLNYHHAVHPVVLNTVINDSQIKSIFVNEAHTDKIMSLTQDESNSILNCIFNSINKFTEFRYRHRWSPGDLVIWHNRFSQHRGIKDFSKEIKRIAKRCVVF